MIAYLTAGDPSPEATPHLIEALERGGADLIELGVPFSDPIADGPVIQQAGDRALAAGTTLAKVLDIAAKVRKRSEIPLLLFTYLNPVVRYGFEKLARDAKAAGIDGCLLTDASVEEAGDYVKVMRERRSRHRISGCADEHGAAFETGGGVFERLRLSGFAHGHHRRAERDRGIGTAADRTHAIAHTIFRWRWVSAFRNPNTWQSWRTTWMRWWSAARSCGRSSAIRRSSRRSCAS
jgi:hypothetical protein